MRALILVLGFFVGAIGFYVGVTQKDPVGLAFGVIGIMLFVVGLFAKSFQ